MQRAAPFRFSRRAALALAAFCFLLTAAAPPPSPRRTLRVLAPVEITTGVARVGVRSYILTSSDPPTVLVLEADEKAGKEKRPRAVPLDRLEVAKDVRLAEKVAPLRTVVIAASFPYRAQVEEFRQSLSLPSAEAVLREGAETAAFRFLGVDLERRTLDARGKPSSDYQPVDLTKSYTPWLLVTGNRFEPEPKELEPVIFPGLVMPRLLLFTGRYPDVEHRLSKLKKTVEDLRKAKASAPAKPFRTDDFDVFGPGGKPGPTPAIPERCLLRVLDVTVEPGRSYQYRLRVRMADPGQAGPGGRTLFSPWREVADAVPTPR